MKQCAFLLINCFLAAFSLDAEDFAGNRSTDGRFELLWSRDNDSSEFAISLIAISSNKQLLSFESAGRPWVAGMRLVWTPDSKRVAYFRDDRRGGGTTVYFLAGSQFVEAPLPKWSGIGPRLKRNERFTKAISDGVSPVCWTDSSTLILREDSECTFDKLDKNGEVTDEDGQARAIATVTVRFGANNKAVLQSVRLLLDRVINALDSGGQKLADNDNDGAIADFTEAIRLDPTNAEAYKGRGDAKEANGDDGGAISDYDRVIQLEPTNADAYKDRGEAKQAKGDNDGAIADSNRAIELNPFDYSIYYDRGTADFVKRDWGSALTDFQQSRKGDPSSAPFIWLIRARQGEIEAAKTELASVMEQRLNNAPDDWESKVTNFLLDKIDQVDFFLAAAASPDTAKQRDQQCDAWFYAGMKRLLAGDKTTAIDYFQKALATGAKTETEYQFAGAELKALGK
jgi:tetratricopeptide (TPR) repeat protein